uniref:Proteasome subunit alpha type n=1 Tax=Alexandrium fundyense TaxID=2932 RepID=A4UHA5_ALEFU|nr:threonine endopeptidase [Alexandrium fundyense]|mmetsp:Transcript_18862/g.39238  ORF Transcript_18862/g.39238 Transcript_18862/m.39238 type:complete len:255 (-) Transcript_18862:146-910(-)
MAGTGAGYDLSVTTFSPDGRVFQVEYAQKAVENSGTTVAICCKDGVIFAVEKFLLSKMLVQGTNKRIFPVHRHAGMSIAGFSADSRQIVARARSEAHQYKNSYNEEIPPELLAERLGLFVHAYTLYWSIRPFGCSVLLGCVDQDTKKPSLFCVDPAGMVFKYSGTAIGKGKQAAKTEIEKLLANGTESLTCAEALVHVAKILHKVHDEKDKDFELEASWICPASNYEHAVVPSDMLKAAETEAKRLIEAEEQED